MAELVEYDLEDEDAAILAVRVALAKGMSWEDLAGMVKEEKKSRNPVAGLIDKLYLARNCMTLLLSNNLDEMDDDEKTMMVLLSNNLGEMDDDEKTMMVEVDFALSAHTNAQWWYEFKKKKQESTQERLLFTTQEKAFKADERKAHLQMTQVAYFSMSS